MRFSPDSSELLAGSYHSSPRHYYVTVFVRWTAEKLIHQDTVCVCVWSPRAGDRVQPAPAAPRGRAHPLSALDKEGCLFQKSFIPSWICDYLSYSFLVSLFWCAFTGMTACIWGFPWAIHNVESIVIEEVIIVFFFVLPVLQNHALLPIYLLCNLYKQPCPALTTNRAGIDWVTTVFQAGVNAPYALSHWILTAALRGSIIFIHTLQKRKSSLATS